MYNRSIHPELLMFAKEKNDFFIKTLSKPKFHIYNSMYILYVGTYRSYIICFVYMYVNNLQVDR